MLTSKQRAFVETYTGNAMKAAKAAEYRDKTAYSIGQRLLKNPDVAAAIKAREVERMSEEVANREARLKFWTSVIYETTQPIRGRIFYILAVCSLLFEPVRMRSPSLLKYGRPISSGCEQSDFICVFKGGLFWHY